MKTFDFRPYTLAVDMDRTLLDTDRFTAELINMLTKQSLINEQQAKDFDQINKQVRQIDKPEKVGEVELFEQFGIDIKMLEEFAIRYLDPELILHREVKSFVKLLNEANASWVVLSHGYNQAWQSFKFDLIRKLLGAVEVFIVDTNKATVIAESIKEYGLNEKGLILIDDRAKHFEGLDPRVTPIHLRRPHAKYADEAASIEGLNVIEISSLTEVVDHLTTT